MAQIQETPLDERQWRSPIAIQNLNTYYGGLHRGTIHMYFAESDFFDKTSNNWALFMSGNPEWVGNRDAFEARLRAMQGLEFMVVSEPERQPDGSDSGVYVVRKQNRRKRPGHDDEITVLATYYVIGEHIYQSGSLEDIIGSKILAATTSLSKFFSLASSLPIYTSGRGYSYFPPSTSVKRAAASANQSRRSSRAGSPTGDISMLDASTDSLPASQANGTQQKQAGKSTAVTNAAAAATSIKALKASFDLFNAYGDEFMDTNPLVGEPGAFTFSSTSRHVQQMNAKAQADAAAAAAAKTAGADGKTAEVARIDSKPGTPATSPTMEPAKRPKVKKSKSRAPTAPTSPSTPTAPTPGPIGGAK